MGRDLVHLMIVRTPKDQWARTLGVINQASRKLGNGATVAADCDLISGLHHSWGRL